MWTDPTMKRYPLLDVFRLLCAGLVVTIHLSPGPGAFVSCIARQAVPFFFLTSGFFFSRKLETAEDKRGFVRTYADKTLRFYLLWVLLLLPQTITIYSRLYAEKSALYIGLILFRRTFLAGTEQFWYLLALAETSLIAGWLLIRRREKLLYFLAGAGFLLCILYALDLPLFRMYNRAVYVLFSWEYNFLMQGLPFFTLGILCSRLTKSKRPGLIPSLCSYLLLTGMSLWLYPTVPESSLLLCPILSLLLFRIGISVENAPCLAKISPHCRDLSGALYCLHGLAAEYVLGELIPWSACYPVNCLTVIAVCAAVYAVVTTIRWKPLYRLITLR